MLRNSNVMQVFRVWISLKFDNCFEFFLSYKIFVFFVNKMLKNVEKFRFYLKNLAASC